MSIVPRNTKRTLPLPRDTIATPGFSRCATLHAPRAVPIPTPISTRGRETRPDHLSTLVIRWGPAARPASLRTPIISHQPPAHPASPETQTPVSYVPLPYIPSSSTFTSDLWFLPTQGVRPLPTAVEEHAVEELNDLSGMVCGEHYHRSTVLDLIPSGRTEGYSVQWQCENLIWNIKICVDCGFRRIMCSKRVEVPKMSPLAPWPPETRLRVLGVWEGIVYEHLFRLHRLGELNKTWCKNDVGPTADDD
ncbi:hypothetical protein C7212DRAFT_367149 [Tuber magnatum]|uniref:Uncharacterized protein n=1 Tax=Tuber magnatum TaxID=42249 RepID=A0A317SBT7_9PEZI|nr:hypothetical protein C7212DRAFT_367149 [Tuber magnatum]